MPLRSMQERWPVHSGADDAELGWGATGLAGSVGSNMPDCRGGARVPT